MPESDAWSVRETMIRVEALWWVSKPMIGAESQSENCMGLPSPASRDNGTGPVGCSSGPFHSSGDTRGPASNRWFGSLLGDRFAVRFVLSYNTDLE